MEDGRLEEKMKQDKEERLETERKKKCCFLNEIGNGQVVLGRAAR